MIITNNHNLPEAIVQAVKIWTYAPKEHSIGVTALVGSPMIRYLQRKHWHEIKEDASDRLWALLGQATHSILDKVEIAETLREEKLTMPLYGYEMILSGRIDLYKGETESIEDYKVTSVYSFLLGDKIEWEQQQNCYAYLYKQHGFDVESLKIHAILRDWQRSRLLKDSNYPKIPFVTKDIPLWTVEQQRNYIMERIEKHMAFPVPECTKEERWYRGEGFAVMKKNRKSAVRVLDTEAEAEEFFIKKELDKNHYIEHRPGTYARCESYCNVADFCDMVK